MTVSVADSALGPRDGLADLSRSFPAHVAVTEGKVQLLMTGETSELTAEEMHDEWHLI